MVMQLQGKKDRLSDFMILSGGTIPLHSVQRREDLLSVIDGWHVSFSGYIQKRHSQRSDLNFFRKVTATAFFEPPLQLE
jgi:hypothetical protein